MTSGCSSRGQKRSSDEERVVIVSKRQKIDADANNNLSLFGAVWKAGSTVLRRLTHLISSEKGVNVATNTPNNLDSAALYDLRLGNQGLMARKDDVNVKKVIEIEDDDEVQFLGTVKRSVQPSFERAPRSTTAALNININVKRNGESSSSILEGLKRRNPNWKNELRSTHSLAQTPPTMSGTSRSWRQLVKPGLSQRLKANNGSLASPNTNRVRRRRAFEDLVGEIDLEMYKRVVTEYQRRDCQDLTNRSSRYGKTYSRGLFAAPPPPSGLTSGYPEVERSGYLSRSQLVSNSEKKKDGKEESASSKVVPEVINLVDEVEDESSKHSNTFPDPMKSPSQNEDSVFKSPKIVQRPKAKSVDEDIVEVLNIYSPINRRGKDDNGTQESKEQHKGMQRQRFNSLRAEHRLHPVADVDFLHTLRSKYVVGERERDLKVRCEQVKLAQAKEKTKELEKALEERMRTHLSITQFDLEQRTPIPDEVVVEEEVLPTITEDMEQVISKSLNSNSNKVLVDAFNIEIGRKDIDTLRGLNWLNDEIINFYLQLVVQRNKDLRNNNDGESRKKGNKNWPSVHAFNTFFYPKLVQSGYTAIRRWTKKIDIFAHDLLLVPVHLGVHWCLATIDNRNKCVRYYDSMGGLNERCVSALVSYLSSEHKDKKKSDLDAVYSTEIVKDIPHQQNGSDCGMFACKFAEYLSRDADITFGQEDMPYFRRRMIYEIVTKTLLHP